MTRLPIRWKFALGAGALVGVTLLVFSGFTLLNLYQEQLEAVDLEINADGRHFSGLSAADSAGESRDIAMLARYSTSMAYVFFDPAGRLVLASERLPLEVAHTALQAAPEPHTVRVGAKPWRIASFRGTKGAVVIGYDLDEVVEIMRDLVLSYALSLPFVAVIAALGGWWVAGFALSPIQSLTREAERIQAESLDHRLPIPVAQDEIQRLSHVLNAMLSRLEASFRQANRFSADASHELRTPLTIMRGEIERLLRAPGILPAHQVQLVSVQEEIERLQHITENLLLLARLDSGRGSFSFARTDLSALVADACEDAELMGASQGVVVVSRIAPRVLIRGDAAQLKRAVLNLLDNAVKFNRPGGQVSCELRSTDGTVWIEVGNTGAGIEETDRDRLFQRFYRAGSSSNAAVKGYGLGLSLSREIVRMHGGDLRLQPTREVGWTCFALSLPVAESPERGTPELR